MKRSTLATTWGLGLVLFGSLLALGANGRSPYVQLRVSVFNTVPASPSTVERAEREAGRILRGADIEVTWLNCPEHGQSEAPASLCSEAVYPSHLQLRIVPASRGLTSSTMGISFSGQGGKGCYADLFYEPIQQLQQETHASPSVILGHVMAHELGHLLLGTNSHSPSGLMRAHWTPEDLANAAKGNLLFSREQALRIADRVSGSSTPPPVGELATMEKHKKETAVRGDEQGF